MIRYVQVLKRPCCFCYFWVENLTCYELRWVDSHLISFPPTRGLHSSARKRCVVVSGTERHPRQGSGWGAWGQGCVFVLPKCHLGMSLLPFWSQILNWAGEISSAVPTYVLRTLRDVRRCSEKKKKRRRKGGEIIANVFRRYSESQFSLCRTIFL